MNTNWTWLALVSVILLLVAALAIWVTKRRSTRTSKKVEIF